MAKVIERVQPRYEVQEVEFGKVYKWHPEQLWSTANVEKGSLSPHPAPLARNALPIMC